MTRSMKAVVLAVVLAVPGLALAQPPEGRPHKGEHRGRHHRPLHEIAEAHAQELGIGAHTIAAMKAAAEAARPELARLHQAARQAHEALRNGTGDAAGAKAAHEAVRARREALRAQIDGMLTEQQRTRLEAMTGKGRPCDGEKSPR